MKMIYLVRHAAAADRSEPISDFDRPLIEKGKKESQKMANLLKSQGIKPQIYLSSSAIRAVETAQIFAKTFGYPKSKIILDEKIYSSSSGSTFIDSIKKLKPEDLIKTCDEKRLTICGYGTIASMLFAAKNLNAKKGELINYSTSFDVSRSLDAVVGYAGIVIV